MVRTQPEARSIVRDIADYIGKRGVIAGGCIRDIVLDREPKDYDVFIYKKMWFDEIVEKKGIFDAVPEKNDFPIQYGSFEVYNATYKGRVVQLICHPDYEPKSKWNDFMEEKDHLNGSEIVNRFPFTINMMYVDPETRRIQIDDKARTALKGRELVFNPDCVPPYPRRALVVASLTKRMFYLADKLGWTISMPMLQQIFDQYRHIDELSDKEWDPSITVKEEFNAFMSPF